MSVAELRSHIEKKIFDQPVEWFPFPHIIIENFFPEDVYDKVLKYNLFQWSDGTRWFSGKSEKADAVRKINATPYQRRQQIYLHKRDEGFIGPEEALDFWTEIKAVFSGDWFPKLIERRMPEYFALRFGENYLREDFHQKCRSVVFLQRHESDYFLGPHTDLPSRIFTCLFSFPDTTGYESQGTQLLRHKEPYVSAAGRRHYEFADFETVKTSEYKPNNFMIFFKTNHSFHAVNPIPEGVGNQRFGMQFQFHEPGRGLMRDLEAPLARRVAAPVAGSEPVAAEESVATEPATARTVKEVA
jgi:hypothetical protein